MKLPNLSTKMGYTLLGSLAVGISLFGLSPTAKAVTVNRGTDYLSTPSGGANFNFGGSIGSVTFSGLPIGTPTATPPDGGFLGIADTVVNRLDSTIAPYRPTLPTADLISGTLPSANITRIQIVGLSLAAIGNYAGKVFVGLDPSKVSGGEMAIAHGNTGDVGGIWSSYFGINGIAVIANAGITLAPQGTDYVRSLISECGISTSYTCLSFSKGFGDFERDIQLDGGTIGHIAGTGASFKAEDEPWAHEPLIDQFQGENLVQPGLEQNFYLTGTVNHDAGDGNHTVTPVPGPLPILGGAAAFSFSRRLKRRIRAAVKAS
jgi:hypothetical protein